MIDDEPCRVFNTKATKKAKLNLDKMFSANPTEVCETCVRKRTLQNHLHIRTLGEDLHFSFRAPVTRMRFHSKT